MKLLDTDKFPKVLIISGFILILLLIIAFTFKVSFFNFDAPINGELFGQFGDIIGGLVGTLWSLAGVTLFYLSLKEQRKDIKANHSALEKQVEALSFQKEEMSLMREEYKMARSVFDQQKNAIKEQARTLKTQQFESNFYSLISIYINIRNRIIESDENFIKSIKKSLTTEKDNKCINSNIIKYMDEYQKNKASISHYFKTIYRIYKTIDSQEHIRDNEKYFYSKILRSQFTEDELFLIFYNTYSNHGQTFRPLALKYNILKHLDPLSRAELISYEQNSALIDFSTWMESFLRDNVSKLHDIALEEPEFSSEKIFQETSCLISITLDKDSNVEFNIETKIKHLEIELSLEEKLETFIKDFLVDRLLNNNFEKSESFNITSQRDSEKISFTISSKNNLKICSDLI